MLRWTLVGRPSRLSAKAALGDPGPRRAQRSRNSPPAGKGPRRPGCVARRGKGPPPPPRAGQVTPSQLITQGGGKCSSSPPARRPPACLPPPPAGLTGPGGLQQVRTSEPRHRAIQPGVDPHLGGRGLGQEPGTPARLPPLANAPPSPRPHLPALQPDVFHIVVNGPVPAQTGEEPAAERGGGVRVRTPGFPPGSGAGGSPDAWVPLTRARGRASGAPRSRWPRPAPGPAAPAKPRAAPASPAPSSAPGPRRPAARPQRTRPRDPVS